VVFSCLPGKQIHSGASGPSLSLRAKDASLSDCKSLCWAPRRQERRVLATSRKPGNRSYERLRSGNDTLALVFLLPYSRCWPRHLSGNSVHQKRKKRVWGPAIKLGLLAAVFLFLQALNDWPLWGAQYDTKASYGSFLLLAKSDAHCWLPPRPRSRSRWSCPRGAALPQLAAGPAELAAVSACAGCVPKEFSRFHRGLSLAAAHIGFLVAFYLVATWLGAWAPQELNYSDSVNTLFPWISGFAIGLSLP